jgi:tagatose-6-phosphate ketose/aldose isomerase
MTTTREPGIRPTEIAGAFTLGEILQQPTLWPTTLKLTKHVDIPSFESAIVTGAGTSAYAAEAIARAWRSAKAIPVTDLLLQSRDELLNANRAFADDGLLISIARSGDSPESVAVVEKIQRLFPAVQHLVITCNAQGGLAKLNGVRTVVLDPRTNDRSLAMTSSFTNLALAGLCITHHDELARQLPAICTAAQQALPELHATARDLVRSSISRVVILAAADLKPLATEVSLKVLEMTAGAVVPMAETFLGLRHGPMSFLRPDTLVLCWMSSSRARRRYEIDLIQELRDKRLGRLVIIGNHDELKTVPAATVPAVAPDLPDVLRVPFEIPFGQLLAYELSVRCGLNPDNPSPNGVITRVVPGFRVHEG